MEDLDKIIQEQQDLPIALNAYYYLSTRDSALIVYPTGLNGTAIQGSYEKTDTKYIFKYNNQEYIYYIDKLPATREDNKVTTINLLQDRTAYYRQEYAEEADEIEGVALLMILTKRN
ncbi:MAG: hypothetical protein LIO65_07490 [Odoribacter sp.]|nr:hypothetical protein [Odoribacter sp.]